LNVLKFSVLASHAMINALPVKSQSMCKHVQAGARWRSFDEARRQRFINRVVESLMEGRVSAEVRRIWVGYWSQCDPALGRGIAMQLQKAAAL
jgi:catalase